MGESLEEIKKDKERKKNEIGKQGHHR